ncbi:hypothetical protein SRB5_46800 [Streptomyces sp. RB5]|uniref:ABC transmembrane type-1 domain-containing protein n=1 Tax=Streptomyces smaragdinus TaxID=2585196 RepID=A0A7K0CNA2_9ACTN|nr:ABC transporter permease subunit [Streptomyces smaragdinus]MQY14512.1 hypothetical protein [Streptomyces smaragdinus]
MTQASVDMPAVTGKGKTASGAGRKRVRKTLLLTAASALFLLLLQIASMQTPDYIVPDVPTVLKATWEVLTEQGSDLLVTLGRFALAILASIVLGWILGLAMASQKVVGEFGEAVTRILLATPSLSVILFAVLWFESIETRVFVVVCFMALPFYIVAVYESVKTIDRDLVEAMRQFRPTRRQLFAHVLFPHTTATVIMTTKSVASFSLRIVVFSEVLVATSGIGSSMLKAQSAFKVDLIFGWTVVLIVVNFLLMAGLDLLERRLLRWRPENAVAS